MRFTVSSVWFALALVVGCHAGGPAADPPQAPLAQHDSPSASPPSSQGEAQPSGQATSEAVASDGAEADAVTPVLPDGCPEGQKPCTPPADFAKLVCEKKYPGLALVMLRKGAPWTKLYVNNREIEPENTFGGPNGEQPLVFGEEVVVLHHRSAKAGSMQVSGNDGYHVLRWDGTCATVGVEALVSYMPGLPQAAPITWNYLSENIREALLTDAQIARAYEAQRQRCRGQSPRRASPDCLRADKTLNHAIVIAVRKGIELPAPAKLPNWAPRPGGDVRQAQR